MCGHPDEFIEVQLHEDNTEVHNLLPIHVYKKYVGKNYRKEVKEARCLRCAKQAKSKDDRDHSKGRGIARSFYMAGLSSTFTIGDDTVLEDGYDRDTSDLKANRHPRVTEAEYEAHRLAVQAEASRRRDKSLHVPKRRSFS